MSEPVEKSPKSYGVAVTLCGLFGTVGIHHFYLGDYLHGFVDLGLMILGIWLIINGYEAMGFAAIALDVLHSIVIFYYLIVEKWRDGQGRLVTL